MQATRWELNTFPMGKILSVEFFVKQHRVLKCAILEIWILTTIHSSGKEEDKEDIYLIWLKTSVIHGNSEH